ncbi:hypothetical protein IT6_03595 [Methylacidiphilum caldifontis]|uniref:DUF6607 family protein n=1 Tax=Methylacidiphilum caldifontis TaxID=2795386 RepID=UPI001A8F176F|nr:DUF6607 family protein [Methylacidiphilum caldifontis]QSR89375.1 hypothetical protein IT6_03595 [Methylacidiphilum caldifontis]
MNLLWLRLSFLMLHVFFSLITLLSTIEPITLHSENIKNDILAEDRKAILSMAGNWKVVYRFNEIFSLYPAYSLYPSYTVKGYEKVIVLEDKDRHISLQHLLVDSRGIVIKHWREDWDYERATFWSYTADNCWRSVVLEPAEVKGCWVQTVWNVDDAPRYASYGKWTHEGGYSEWISHKLWRPLPRRETTRRSDYNVMESVMHQIVLQQGWILQEDNEKWVYDHSKEHALARELGVIIYQKENKLDFSPAVRYMQKTGPFWEAVRAVWNNIFVECQEVKYKGKGDARKLAEKLTEEATKFDTMTKSGEDLKASILSWIKEYCILTPAKNGKALSFNPHFNGEE